MNAEKDRNIWMADSYKPSDTEIPTGHQGTSCNSGNGGGNNMETRIAVLEVETKHIKDFLSEIKTDIKDVKKDTGDIKVGIARFEGQFSTIKWGLPIIVGLLVGIVVPIILKFIG